MVDGVSIMKASESVGTLGVDETSLRRSQKGARNRTQNPAPAGLNPLAGPLEQSRRAVLLGGSRSQEGVADQVLSKSCWKDIARPWQDQSRMARQLFT